MTHNATSLSQNQLRPGGNAAMAHTPPLIQSQPAQQGYENPKTAGTFPGIDIFLDSADLEAIRAAKDTGLVDGITTNPTLVATMGAPSLEALCRPILDLNIGPTSIEVTAEDSAGMIQQGKLFHSWGPNVVVKIPLTVEGLKACRALADQAIPVNVTLCFSLTQAILAAKAGATYISLFLGRLEDQGLLEKDLVDLVRSVGAGLVRFKMSEQDRPKLLLASLRSLPHVNMALEGGADVITVPPKLFAHMFDHVLTTRGLSTFAKDGQTIPISCQP